MWEQRGTRAGKGAPRARGAERGTGGHDETARPGARGARTGTNETGVPGGTPDLKP